MDFNIKFSRTAKAPVASGHKRAPRAPDLLEELDEEVIAGRSEDPEFEKDPDIIGEVERTGAEPTESDYWERIRKYVPTEAIGAYLILDGIVLQIWEDETSALRIALIVIIILLAFLTATIAKNVLDVKARKQRLVSVMAFVVWTVATGSLASTYEWWEPAIATGLIVIFGVFAYAYRWQPSES